MGHESVVQLLAVASKLSEAVLIDIAAVLDEADLIAVPGQVAPVRLEIFKEDLIELQILTHLQQNLVITNTIVALKFDNRPLFAFGELFVGCLLLFLVGFDLFLSN